MQWTPEAENAIKKVPFFVRKRVRARVENEAGAEGKNVVTISEVTAAQQRYLTGMASEIKGYQIDGCFGSSGCPNQILSGQQLAQDIEELLQHADLKAFLADSGVKDLKYHHEFRISMADCPNACSQPQIKDIGIIGAGLLQVTDRLCADCGACEKACRENALTVAGQPPRPVLHGARCLYCGQCSAVCPTGSLTPGPRGYRVQLGGKLGRHPRLALPLPGIYAPAAVLEIIRSCLELYKSRSRQGRRFADIITGEVVARFAAEFASKRLVV